MFHNYKDLFFGQAERLISLTLSLDKWTNGSARSTHELRSLTGTWCCRKNENSPSLRVIVERSSLPARSATLVEMINL